MSHVNFTKCPYCMFCQQSESVMDAQSAIPTRTILDLPFIFSRGGYMIL